MTSGYPFNIGSKGQRSEGHRVQKHVEGDRVAGVSLHSIDWPASSFLCTTLYFDKYTRSFKIITSILLFRNKCNAVVAYLCR